MTGERGFTLLEVLVAFVIAALALGVLYDGTVSGLRTARTADRYGEAVSRAQSRLAAVGQGTPLVPGTRAGDDGDGFRWRVRIVPEGTAPAARGPEAAAGPHIGLFAVSVAISWTDGAAERVVQLDSQRATRVAPPAP